MSAGVVEIAGDGSIADVLARTAPIFCVDHRIVDAPCLGHQPAAIQSAGDKIGRQRVAAAGEVTGRRAKSRRDQGGVLTPVYIGIFPFVDGVIAGRSAEQVIVRGLHGIFQGAGLRCVLRPLALTPCVIVRCPLCLSPPPCWPRWRLGWHRRLRCPPGLPRCSQGPPVGPGWLRLLPAPARSGPGRSLAG